MRPIIHQTVVGIASKMRKRPCSICGRRIMRGEMYWSKPRHGDIQHFGCYLEQQTGYAVVEGRACWWPRRNIEG